MLKEFRIKGQEELGECSQVEGEVEQNVHEWVGSGETSGTVTFQTGSARAKGETSSSYDTIGSLRGEVMVHAGTRHGAT